MEDEIKRHRALAVQRYKTEENPEAICTSLGKSKSWLYRWVGRYLEGDITISGNQYINAMFTQYPPVLLGGTYYPAIPDAYVVAVSGSVIKTHATTFTGDLIINKAVPSTLKGGFNADYSAQTGMTTIQGKLTVGKGSLVVNRRTIK